MVFNGSWDGVGQYKLCFLLIVASVCNDRIRASIFYVALIRMHTNGGSDATVTQAFVGNGSFRTAVIITAFRRLKNRKMSLYV